MPKYDVEWEARGRLVVEADDPEEAEQIVFEAVSDFDHTMAEAIDVEGVDIISTEATSPDYGEES
ncbi:hypothetical protein SEA_TESLA_17 [Mycobacterium phage Tesla]|uniref:Uncharacterized protein n=2 Tax=Marvinvirus mosmoris TaxID=1982093 RepID=A0A2L1J029_9CAUD|nr:hypothetical protein SEA_TESLA_17 [Mycobacterium phage Tesla]QAX93069.1 hypothetical protein SEA_REDRAIDER77_18 [Mycobacterium phage RedRaider77]